MFILIRPKLKILKIVSEYDQEIPQSQTADNPFGYKVIITIGIGMSCDMHRAETITIKSHKQRKW